MPLQPVYAGTFLDHFQGDTVAPRPGKKTFTVRAADRTLLALFLENIIGYNLQNCAWFAIGYVDLSGAI